MELDLSSIPGISNLTQTQSTQQQHQPHQQYAQPSTPAVIRSLVMSSIPTNLSRQQANLLFSSDPHDDVHQHFNSIPFDDVTVDTHHNSNVSTLHTINTLSSTAQPKINSSSTTLPVTKSHSQKRSYDMMRDSSNSQVELSSIQNTTSLKTQDDAAFDETTNEGATAGRCQIVNAQFSSACPTDIDPHVVCQMGGLAFAELCKERAREQFKERKKNEHLANGKFHRLKRRKKNDTTMSEKEKYVRRLQMNQDSAAAARYAHEVYIQVLEKLVKMSEEERGTFALEMQRIRAQNEHLVGKVQELQSKVEEIQGDGNGDEFDNAKQSDPSFNKIIDFLKGPSSISVEFGVQPARAV